MKRQNRWLLALLTSCLLGGSFFGPLELLHAAPSPEKAAPEQPLVNVNKASSTELEAIRGVGPMLAQRIIDYRTANGRFERLEDLVQVPGIGQAKFEKIKNQVTL
jgi:competence protein ComEA